MATADVQSILKKPAADEIHMEDWNHGLAWTKSSNGIYNTKNSQQDLRVNSFIWIMWCQNDQRKIDFQMKVWSREVKFTPQNPQLLFFWMSIFGFLSLLQTFVGVADITWLEDFLTMLAAMNIFHAFPCKGDHAEKHVIGHWTDSSVYPITVKQYAEMQKKWLL